MEILIIEDDKSTRDVLLLYLCDEHEGQNCEYASSIEEAARAISRKRHDLILLDLLLEGQLATPLVGLARKLYADSCPDIYVMSAMVGADRVAEQNRVTGFIKKPFSLDIIDKLVSKERNEIRA